MPNRHINTRRAVIQFINTRHAVIQLFPSWCCGCHIGTIRRLDLGFGVLVSGVKENGASSNPHLDPLRLLPWFPRCVHSFHSLSFSTKYRQSPSKISKQSVGPLSVPPTNPVTHSLANGLGACENATFTWVNDDPRERPPFHIQILRAYPCTDHTRNLTVSR